jgi:hypothetical protein
MAERGEEEGRVLAETDGSGGDGERRGETELEEEQERQQAAEAAGIDDAEEVVGAAGGGEGGAEFGPDKAVAEGEKGAEDPAEHGLRAGHSGENQRQGDEGADADHVEQVEGDGSAEGERARELGGRIGVERTDWSSLPVGVEGFGSRDEGQG